MPPARRDADRAAAGARASRRLTRAALLLGASIHLPPLLGVLGNAMLSRLYGTTALHGELLVLMRHRAVLFGLLAAFLLHAAVTRRGELPALLASTASMAAFLALALPGPALNASLQRVAWVDAVVLLVTLAALALRGVYARTPSDATRATPP